MAALGCDRGSPTFENDKGPAPQIVWTSPANAATGVALRQSVRVQFDRFLRPDSTSRQSICIQAGPNNGCVISSLEYDPVDRVMVAKPMADLLPNTAYNVRLLVPTKDGPDDGVRAFDDVPLAEEARFSFTTGTATSMPTLAEPVRAADFCGAEPTPSTTLIGCSACHNAIGMGGRLNLGLGGAFQLKTQSQGVRQTVSALVTDQTVAVETATAPNPIEVRRAGNSPFGQNMPYIDKGNPANSYLLYKMLIAPTSEGAGACVFDLREAALIAGSEGAPPMCASGSGGPQPWVPAGSGKPAVLGEYDRLFSRLVGQPMDANLPSVRAISAWIAAGANTPASDCPAPPAL